MKVHGLVALASTLIIGCNSTEPQSTLTTTLGDVTIEGQGLKTKASSSDLLNSEITVGTSELPAFGFTLGGNNSKNSGYNNLSFGIRDSESGGASVEFSVSELHIGPANTSINESTNFKLWASRPNGDYAKVSIINKDGIEGGSNTDKDVDYKIGKYFSVNGNVATFSPNSMILDLEKNDPNFSEAIGKAKRFTVYFQVDGQMVSPNGTVVSPFQFSLLKE